MSMPSSAERRRAKRKNISLAVRVKVPLPEGGSATLVAKANIVNLSQSGVGLRLHSLRREHVPLLTKARRKCILYCDFPGSKEPVVLRGDITWMDIRIDTTPSAAYLGVRLDPDGQEGIQRLEQFL